MFRSARLTRLRHQRRNNSSVGCDKPPSRHSLQSNRSKESQCSPLDNVNEEFAVVLPPVEQAHRFSSRLEADEFVTTPFHTALCMQLCECSVGFWVARGIVEDDESLHFEALHDDAGVVCGSGDLTVGVVRGNQTALDDPTIQIG